nr:hypothetical protein [Tanacetum cinerariifolium]
MALPDKHQLKFNSHKDAKTLMEAIEKRFGGNTETKKEDINLKFLRSLPSEWRTHTLIWRNKSDLEEQSLDDLFNSLNIYEAEVKSSSSVSTSTQNIAFVSSSYTDSTNEPVSAAASVSAVSAKMHVSSLLNVDSMSNAVIYSFFTSQSSSPQLDNDDLKQIDRTGRNLGANGPTSMGFDMSKVECYNCHKNGHFVRECRSPKDSRRNVITGVFKQKRSLPTMLLWHSHLQVLLLTMRDNALVSLRQNLEKAKQEMDDLKLKLEKFQTSFKNITKLLASQTKAKTGLGYNSQVFTRAMFDCDDYLSLESDESFPPSPIYDRYQSGNGYHAISPPYTGTFMPPKPNLVFNNAPNDVETENLAFNVKLSPHTIRTLPHIIEDWVSDSEDESETKTPQNVPSFVQPTEQVKSPRPSVQHVETSIPPKTSIPKPTSNGKCKNRKACFVHMVHAALLPQSKPVHITTVRPVSTDVPKTSVTRPKQVKPIVTKPKSPTRRHINCILSPKASNSPLRFTAVQALVVNAAQGMQGKWEWKPKCLILDHGNPQHALKDKEVIDSGCSRHMIGNMSYLSNFEELKSRDKLRGVAIHICTFLDGVLIDFRATVSTSLKGLKCVSRLECFLRNIVTNLRVTPSWREIVSLIV